MIIPDWVIWVDSEKDRLIWDISIPKIHAVDKEIYEYNQYKLKANRKSCTLFACFWAVSDLFNYKFTDEEIKEMNKLSYKAWRMKNKWRRLYKAVDVVREYRNNKHPDKQIVSFKLEANSEQHREALKKRHTTPTVYHWNSKYNKDIRLDWTLNWTKFWTSTYWHAIGLRNIDFTRVKDSQYWYKYNKYLLKDYQGLISSNVFSSVAYLFLPIESIKESKEALKIKQIRDRVIKQNSMMRKLIDNELEQSKVNETAKNKLHEANESLRDLDILTK